jgi:hypothetical protein
VRARAQIGRRFQFPDDEVTLQRDIRSLGIRLDDLDEDTSVIESGSSSKLPPEQRATDEPSSTGPAGGGPPVSRERLSDLDAPPSDAPPSDAPSTRHDIRDEPTREAGGPSLPILAAISVIVSIDPDAGVVRIQPHRGDDEVPAGAARALLVPSTEAEAIAVADLFRVIGEA